MTEKPITHIVDYLDKDFNPTTEEKAHFISEIFFDENGNIKEKTISYVIDGEKESYCPDCGESIDLVGPQSTIIPKKKKKDERVGLSLPSTVKAKKKTKKF